MNSGGSIDGSGSLLGDIDGGYFSSASGSGSSGGDRDEITLPRSSSSSTTAGDVEYRSSKSSGGSKRSIVVPPRAGSHAGFGSESNPNSTIKTPSATTSRPTSKPHPTSGAMPNRPTTKPQATTAWPTSKPNQPTTKPQATVDQPTTKPPATSARPTTKPPATSARPTTKPQATVDRPRSTTTQAPPLVARPSSTARSSATTAAPTGAERLSATGRTVASPEPALSHTVAPLHTVVQPQTTATPESASLESTSPQTVAPRVAASTPASTTQISMDELPAGCVSAGCVMVESTSVQTLSLSMRNVTLRGSSSSSSGSSSGALESGVIIVDTVKKKTLSRSSSVVVTPYRSDFCRCRASECQNEYPGNTTGPMCEATLGGASACRVGYKMCVSTDSYKLEVTPATPNSVADVMFTLLASDIIGAFHNLGDASPLVLGTKWWVTLSLPATWRFVTWDMTSVSVTLTGQQSRRDVSRTVGVRPCSAVTDVANCASLNSTRVGFINVMDLLQDRQDLMTLVSRAPITFKVTRSVVSGPRADASASVGVVLTYEKASGALDAATRVTRELAVDAELLLDVPALSATANLDIVSLATMGVPATKGGEIQSSLIWVDGDSNTLTLSFSTAAIVSPRSVDPQVCVNLRSSMCARKGRVASANVTFENLASAAYMKDGNPFLGLYASPGDSRLEVASVNETYFCVKKLLPSGAGANQSWEVNKAFTFQLQVAGVMWSRAKVVNATARTRLPALAEVILIDGGVSQGSDCAQLLSHESTNSNHGLSIYSVMSVTIYSVALVGAILITRMNGVTFSSATFFNDMTSVCVVLVFTLSIIGNAIWIHVSSHAQETSSAHIYFLLRQLTLCCTWTMMTAVCFHWLSVLHHDVRRRRRVYVLLAFVLSNVAFYTFVLYGLVSLADLYKCAYNDYLKNPRYTMRLCESDYCPDLQPAQWKYATEHVCKAVHDSSWFVVAEFGAELLVFATALALLVLGAYVLRRGSRLVETSGDVFDDKIVAVMKKSLRTYLAVIVAISCSLGVSVVLNLVLYTQAWTVNAVLWYTFTIWLPTLVPPAGFLVLQWNPRLHGMNWNPSLHVKDRNGGGTGAGAAGKEPTGDKHAMLADNDNDNDADDLLSGTWVGGMSSFPDTEYAPIGAESIEGSNQNVLALSVQLVSKVPLAHACFIELYVAELSENDVTGDDVFDDLPSAVRHRSSISSLLQTGLQHEGMRVRRGQSMSLRTSIIGMNTSQWVRVGFTETVLPTLVTTTADGMTATQVATFLSVLQIPVMPTNPVLRFVVYELPDGVVGTDSPTHDDTVAATSHHAPRSSSMQLDERARHARVSGMGLAPPTRPQVFCEFTCSSSELLAADEMNLVAREGSHRRYTMSSSAATVESPLGASSSRDDDAPHLRIKSMTVSTRTLKENNGFYVTKSFQFADGNEMVVEDMTESVFTNEIPRQYLELLRAERTDDLARARAELASYDAKCKAGLLAGLYDNLIDQIQDENDQTVVRKWLDDRVQRRRVYADALRECHQMCIARAEDGVNFKASTEKKSLRLRFLPINLHVQDMWVGPTADLRSQRSRRTSSSVKVYPTTTVGAFAAHCFKFRHGGSILSLRSKLQKRSLSRLESGTPEPNTESPDDMDWTKPELRAQDEIRWQLTTRLDMCVSQALTALVTSFCRSLEVALQHPVDRQFVHVVDAIGFLFQVESLLSTQGKEIGMLEDFSASVDALKTVTFVLDTSPPSHLPSTLNLHLRNTQLPSVVSVRVNKGARAGAFSVVVGVRCPSDVLAALPARLRTGGAVSVTPVLFTQGINEMQTLANNASGKKTYLQDTINQKSFRVLAAYVEKYKKLATAKPDVVPTPVSVVVPLVASLEERITAARKQVVRTKHPKIIQESSRLCRLLGAGRVTSCKSAKDRTGMSVTLEQIQLLCDHHGLPQEYAVRTVSTMRSNGVRLENAFKNTGKRQYAFNALQRSLLPDEYKCPEGTYGRGQVS